MPPTLELRLSALCTPAIVPGLARIRSLLKLLGHPERGLKAIHVAGSNGKGSVCRMLESVLLEQGYRVGMFISPHLVDFRERFRMGGRMASWADLEACAPALLRALRVQAARPEGAATYFEALTALAFLYFKRQRARLVVLETGLGGRFDSTNVLARPLLTVITNISLEHTQILGKTVSKIAWEKAGILKKGSPLATTAEGPARSVILREFRRVQAGGRAKVLSLRRGKEWRVLYWSEVAQYQWQILTLEALGRPWVLGLPLLGAHQHQNLACALAGLTLLKQGGLHVDEPASWTRGLAKARWPGRLQVVGRRPLTILDGAHNPSGAAALTAELARLRADLRPRRVALAAGVLKDKDWKGMFGRLASQTDRFFLATPPDPRGLEAGVLAAWLGSRGKTAETAGSLPQALARARAWAGPRGLVLLAGSLYSVGAVLKKVQKR